MPQFPQLVEEDFHQIDAFLKNLLAKSQARTALFVEKAGYLICQSGDVNSINTTEVATLGSNAFNATQFMADRVGETNFSSMFQQGEQMSVLWVNIDENSLLMVVFSATMSVGAVKFYALTTVQEIGAVLRNAEQREPGGGIDLATLDPTDVSVVFKRKSSTQEVAPVEDPAAAAPEPEPPPAEKVMPLVAQKGPYVQQMQPGTYFWCACGRSQTQPFCDGSHKGTGIAPKKVEVKEAGPVYWCGCKCSSLPPYCDGTHGSLP